MSVVRPLQLQSRVSLFLSLAFAAVGFAVGLNALIKANQERSYINRLVVPHGIIDIGIHDVFASGAVITVICAFISVLSSVLFAFTWCPIEHKPSSFRFQSWALFLCAAWLLATLVTYDYFFVTRSAQITINLHGQRVPETIVQRLADLLDFTRAYRDVYYLRLLAVIPWFTFISALVSGAILYLAVGRAEAILCSNNQHVKKCGPTGPQFRVQDC